MLFPYSPSPPFFGPFNLLLGLEAQGEAYHFQSHPFTLAPIPPGFPTAGLCLLYFALQLMAYLQAQPPPSLDLLPVSLCFWPPEGMLPTQQSLRGPAERTARTPRWRQSVSLRVHLGLLRWRQESGFGAQCPESHWEERDRVQEPPPLRSGPSPRPHLRPTGPSVQGPAPPDPPPLAQRCLLAAQSRPLGCGREGDGIPATRLGAWECAPRTTLLSPLRNVTLIHALAVSLHLSPPC